LRMFGRARIAIGGRRSATRQRDQLSINRTSPARGPFCESSGVKSTRWPSRRSSNTAPRTELRWKKCSIPPSSRMNPNPLSMRSRAIVPVGIPRPSRSEPLGISQGYSAGYGRSKGQKPSGRGAGRVCPSLVELEIAASLGRLSREVNNSLPLPQAARTVRPATFLLPLRPLPRRLLRRRPRRNRPRRLRRRRRHRGDSAT